LEEGEVNDPHEGMSKLAENEELVEDLSKPVAAEAAVVSSTPSRIIEYFPPGPTVTARNCVWQGNSFSKGGRVKMDDGAVYECTGDDDGSWKKAK
jgi:hypothetical protein